MSITMYVHTYIYYACVHVYKYASLNKKNSTDQVIAIVNVLLGGIYAVFSFFFFNFLFCIGA